MNFIRFVFSYYINNNFHVGIASASLTAVSLYEITGEVNLFYPLFVFFSTLLAYHFIRIFDERSVDLQTIVSRIITQTWDILLIIVVSSLVVSLSLLNFEIVQLLLLLPAFFITFWYAIPLRFLSKRATSLRNYPKLKLITIAIVWSVVTVLIPLQKRAIDIHLLFLFLQRLLIVMVLVLPFDIRDMLLDNKKLQTVPQQIGVRKTKQIGFVLLVFFLMLSFSKNTITSTFLPELAITLLTALLLYKAKIRQTKYFASFWVESIPVVWFLLLIFHN